MLSIARKLYTKTKLTEENKDVSIVYKYWVATAVPTYSKSRDREVTTWWDRAMFPFLNTLMNGSVRWKCHISQACVALVSILTCYNIKRTQTITTAEWLHTISLFHKALAHGVAAKTSDYHPQVTPYLPRLLQLGCPPLLQDGLHGTDEFCSDVLQNNYMRCLMTCVFLGN